MRKGHVEDDVIASGKSRNDAHGTDPPTHCIAADICQSNRHWCSRMP
jgi:hypothetical protein